MSASPSTVQNRPKLYKNIRNIVKVKWVGGENGITDGSICVSLKQTEPFIVQKNTALDWIVTRFRPSSTTTFTNDLFFLVANRQDTVWINYDSQFGELPLGRIPCHKPGKYGNIFVGRMKQGDIGMVVNHKGDWTFYINDIEQGIKQGFQVLCIKQR